jgi:hypothetical protein
MVMIKSLRKMIWAFRYKRAIKKADKAAKDYNTTYMVLLYNGKLKVASRKALKNLIAQRRFKKGVTIRDFDKNALYIAK